MERLRLAAILCATLIGLLALWYGIEEASYYQGGQGKRTAPRSAMMTAARPARAAATRTTSLPVPAPSPEPISGGSCDPSRLPIQMIVVRNAQEVTSSAANWPDAPALVRENETVIFSNGLVATADVEGTSAHLHELGWASRRIEFMVAAGLRSKSTRLRRRG